jgi:uncharacterized protein
MSVAAAPFRQFIVKVHSRCNLSCTYCYVYHHADQSWRSRPKVMSADTVAAVAERIGRHARRHDLPEVMVVLHGGEPLLAGPAVLVDVAQRVRAAVPVSTQVDITLQTNGTLLTSEFLERFLEHRIQVGISLDGGREAHDRHRVHLDGRPSFAQVERALRLIGRPRYRRLYAGLLCTVDLANDPLRTYEDLLAFDPPRMDLLIPLGNRVHRPPNRPDDYSTPYGDWLIALFDRWYDAPRRETGIRLFESLIELLVGGASETEAVGLHSTDAITIETDGTLEITDALKSTRHGRGATGLDVHRNSLDEAMVLPGVLNMRRGADLLPSDCRGCPVHWVCGGGQYAHRYGPDDGFDHRSVYCPDLYALIAHVAARLRAELAARRLRAAGAGD